MPGDFLCYDKKIENKMSKSNKKNKYKCLISFHGYIYMFPDFPHDPFFRVETEINSLWIQFDLI